MIKGKTADAQPRGKTQQLLSSQNRRLGKTTLVRGFAKRLHVAMRGGGLALLRALATVTSGRGWSP
jgi:hypothetical protein